MARKAKITVPFPHAGEVWTCKNGDVRRVIATNGPFIEWELISSLFGCRTAKSGICDHKSWSLSALSINPA